MNSMDRQLASSGAVGRAGAGVTAPALRKALMVLGVALAALASAIVLVLVPQPIPSAPQVSLACRGAETSPSAQAALVQPLSRVARSTVDSPAARCA
jgi:hypothetical protein